ncbi:tyrosine-type recombinase/integrase [Zophobihabitans entericus]|uniref:Integrase arm-type DNA-binding domain-containing protein n=1 Tax=Zophobihabitans entericus TaxID=1635327 RepID=A0A6G9I946_9GAMM|nr:integrase arm-type DNA-binding domain-containing protein [Zophobihabitans entericus]QIQ20244.1 integrase arm-type DNA-binding domain-containing protein [Zophobihabitans entericus]
MALTDVAIRNAKPRSKPYKLSDGFGLHIIINPSGSKLWYQKYRFDGKEKRLAYGAYPTVSLSAARKLCEEAKTLLSQSIDPGAEKQKEKVARQVGKRFEETARSWWIYQGKLSGWSESYSHSIVRAIETYLFPVLKNRLVVSLKTQDLLLALKAVERKGYLDTVIRLKYCLTSIMRYALQNGIIEYNPALDLQGAVQSPKKKHYPALPLERLPELFERIDLYSQGRARQLTLLALKLNIYLFVRSSELRLARWNEIDLERAMWIIPDNREPLEGVRYSYRGAKMSEYLVPLSTQAVSLFREVQEMTGENELIFPCLGRPHRPLSENTINQALRRLGYDTQTEICGHGLRTIACGALNESGQWSTDAIERQMSHQERNSVRAAYIHKAQFIDERKRMMQWWADYLDANKVGFVAPYEFE